MKELFLDKSLRTGGIYALDIELSKSVGISVIQEYYNYLWTLDTVEGPYDVDFNKVKFDINNYRHEGLLHLGQLVIPFQVYCSIKDDTELNSYTFSIGFYQTAIETIFQKVYPTWIINKAYPIFIDNFLSSVAKKLYKIFPFQLGVLDLEVGENYNLNSLKGTLENLYLTRFYIGRENYDLVVEENRQYIVIMD